MPSLLVKLLGTLGSVLLSLGAALVTEKVMKRLVLFGLKEVSRRTENTTDDELVRIVEEAWSEKKD